MAAAVIVVGNEKGGAGKSTLAIHLICALLHGCARVSVIDLDLRQKSVGRFIDNRRAWVAANEVSLPEPRLHALSDDDKALARLHPETQTARFNDAYEAAC